MVQINPVSDIEPKEYLNIKINNPELKFAEAKDIAKQTALTRCGSPMILSWSNGKTGKFYPDYECGVNKEPFWIRFAEARGANLTIDINNGEFVFMILKL